jgi:uncharacterized protein (DUF169 family)
MASSDWDREGWREALDAIEINESAVGVKFSTNPLEGIPRLERPMRLCEMLRAAQGGKVFCAGSDDHLCGAAAYALGRDLPPVYTSGVYGAGLEIFDSPRAGSRLYDHVPRLEPRQGIEWVSLAPLEKVTYDPDLLIVLTKEEQTEVLLRAMSYGTGKMWTSRSTGVIGCAWLFVYPYQTGELNFTPVLSLGMRALNVFPPGRHLVSIPFDLLPGMLDSLKRMPLILPSLQPGGEEFRKSLLKRLGLDPTH